VSHVSIAIRTVIGLLALCDGVDAALRSAAKLGMRNANAGVDNVGSDTLSRGIGSVRVSSIEDKISLGGTVDSPCGTTLNLAVRLVGWLDDGIIDMINGIRLDLVNVRVLGEEGCLTVKGTGIS
jgi:hypothetical protein